MRRPFDWIVSISLMALAASPVLTDSDPGRRASVPVDAVSAWETSPEGSPFAWIREDGSQVYLPSTGPTGAASAPSPGTPPVEVVYTWTLPMVTPATEIRTFP